RPPSPRDHRLRPPPQRPDGAAVPDRRLEELRQVPLREKTRPHHSGDAPRTGRRALVLAQGPGETALFGKGETATHLARPLQQGLDHSCPPRQYPPPPAPGLLTVSAPAPAITCLFVSSWHQNTTHPPQPAHHHALPRLETGSMMPGRGSRDPF